MEGDKFSKEWFLGYNCSGKTLETFENVIDFLTADKKGKIMVCSSTPESRGELVSEVEEYLESRRIRFSMKEEPSENLIDNILIDVDGKEVVFITLLLGEQQQKKKSNPTVKRMRFPERLELRDEKQGISADILVIKTGEKVDNGNYKIIEVEYKVLDIVYDVKVQECTTPKKRLITPEEYEKRLKTPGMSYGQYIKVFDGEELMCPCKYPTATKRGKEVNGETVCALCGEKLCL